ncbi:MAG: hypothetical protein ACRYFZ_07470 [Janthinobacterium lividum]
MRPAHSPRKHTSRYRGRQRLGMLHADTTYEACLYSVVGGSLPIFFK